MPMISVKVRIDWPEREPTSMTKSNARKDAQAVANSDQISMVLAFNPYDEFADGEADKFGYWPLTARKIFTHEMVIEILDPT